jgi:beta-glucosidase
MSNWHRFSHTPGMVVNDDTGDVACDHYNRFAEDIALMHEIGLTGYRFSIAWGRILPSGTGRVNQKGLDFYSRLVDGLLEAGIEPFATLYHWDLPAALDDRGGWLNRDIAEWFAEYAELVFRALDGRVKKWVTLNEPWVVADGGYLHGVLAPGHRSPYEAPIVSHNLMRAHGAAVVAYRATGAHEIGLVVNLEPKYPASERPEDLEATRLADAYMNRHYLDPALLGSYPEEMPMLFGEAWPEFPLADFDLIRQPLDFLGINYYKRGITKGDPSSPIEKATRVENRHATHTVIGWEVYPAGLTDILVWVKERYGDIPLYVTENGAAFYDPPFAIDDRIDDPLRVAYLADHIDAIGDAIAAGVDLRGYFVWSLLDNFEWSQGYSARFGIVHVDYSTQKRTLKESARFYAGVIERNGEGEGAVT